MRDVGYARISKDDLLLGRGVARQEQDVRNTSERTGGTLVELLVDNDTSASRYSRKRRPGWARVLELVGAGLVDRIVAYDIDRLLRQPRELEDLIDLVEHRPGFVVLNVSGELDITTSDGRFIARLLVAKAAKESDDTSRRLKRLMDANASAGRRHGRRPFGYACAPNSRGKCGVADCPHDGRSIVPSEAALIRKAVRDFLAGESLNAITREWDAAGAANPQGGAKWTSTHVRAVIAGPYQAGLRRHRGEIVGPGDWEPIVDRASHEAVKRILNDPARRRKNPPRRQPFTGILRTTEGVPLHLRQLRGTRVYTPARGPGRPKPEVFVTVAADPVEAFILELLFTAVESGAVAERRAARGDARPAVPDVAGLEADLRQLAQDFGAGLVTRAEWLSARQPLEERLRFAQAAAEVAAEAERAASIPVDLRAEWEGLSVDRKRAVLGAVFERVVIHPATRRGPGLDPSRVEPIWRD